MIEMTKEEFESLPVYLNKPPLKRGDFYRCYGEQYDCNGTLAKVLQVNESEKGNNLILEMVLIRIKEKENA